MLFEAFIAINSFVFFTSGSNSNKHQLKNRVPFYLTFKDHTDPYTDSNDEKHDEGIQEIHYYTSSYYCGTGQCIMDNRKKEPYQY